MFVVDSTPDITAVTITERDKQTTNTDTTNVIEEIPDQNRETDRPGSTIPDNVYSSSGTTPIGSTSYGSTVGISTSTGYGTTAGGINYIPGSAPGSSDGTTQIHTDSPTEGDTTYHHTSSSSDFEHDHDTTAYNGGYSPVPPPVHPPRPPVPEIPTYKPPPPPSPYPTPRIKKGGRINSEAEERTAMIIGIIAGALIAVILVILLVLWFKQNGDQNYKTDHEKSHGYGHGPNAALLGPSSRGSESHHHGTNGSTMPLNGSLRNGHDKVGSNNLGGGVGAGGGMGASGNNVGGNGVGLVPKPKKRDSKDIKEWYV